ncbi:chaperone NapD [Litorilituus sediminis]|uniref:chaperone NapD n=1 Tax=Litorilituus sediminis TaxID=718192 RepID=UPI0014770FF1|nr:chaperone NapD [Litorilituus sediminis]
MINLLEENPVNIAGVLFVARPENVEEVAGKLAEFPGAEVHETSDNGNMVVTIEEDNKDQRLIETITTMSNIPGVISSSLIFHHNDAGLAQFSGGQK